MQSEPTTTKVVSSNPAPTMCTRYNIKVCQSIATVLWFSPGISISSTNKTDHHDITEKVLKVALNTITLTPTIFALEVGNLFLLSDKDNNAYKKSLKIPKG